MIGPLIKIAAPLAKTVLGPLATMASATNVTIHRKMRGRRTIATSGVSAVRAEIEIALVIPNGDMDDIIRIIKSLKSSAVLIYGVSESIKHEIKKKKSNFLVCY